MQQPSVLSTVPMWFGLLDLKKSLQMVEKLSAEQHSSDWGMRIISSQNPMYGPEGYHMETPHTTFSTTPTGGVISPMALLMMNNTPK